MNDKSLPFNQFQPLEQIQRLTQIVQQAYFLRSRQLPANFTEVVSALKQQLLRNMGAVPVDTLELAVTQAALDNSGPLSVAFFYAAVKKAWYNPKSNVHGWDDEVNTRPDLEGDTIDLLDTCADILRRMDADTEDDPRKPLKGSICLPAFNARREFEYLKLRGQVTPQTAASKLTQALEAVNAERIASQHPRIRKEDALKDPDVVAQCRRLAVIDWLRACNISETTPRAVLVPLQDAATYNELRAKY